MVDKVQLTPAITVTGAHVEMYEGLTREMALGRDPGRPAAVHGHRARLAGQGPADGGAGLRRSRLEDHEELRVGDTMHSRSRIVSKRSLRDGGLVVDERTILDQHGEVVQQGKFTFLVAKRQKEASRMTFDPRHQSRALARRRRPRGRPLVLQGDRLHRRGPRASAGRRRPLLDRDHAVQLEPPEAGREGEGGHPRRRRHADRVQHDLASPTASPWAPRA